MPPIEKLIGNAHKFGDDINTDLIISGRYKFKTINEEELARHVMEDIDPEFYKKIKKGDFIVAGKNFGCGSSREQAPIAIKYAGISAVIAKSFARIFFRNAINIGLLVIECEHTDKIDDNDLIEIDLRNGSIFDRTKNLTFRIRRLPKVMLHILEDGGLVEHFRKHGGFKLE
ncbi:MAG: 3-isopropylmalate dehydratase [Candidatus Altiarchaeales archaeon]|nr:MAG: 3-isopropylmalate dehydratase [Candidatus Altiarchaeales archaeon]RLI95618.1 MAG: 3-isopropylmalate dehydratase [Candidatus Altiarchaeales archaeon]HDO82755.1 3-isopropylmalate dehydratase small subunit [Candidatus Altiarchaeales archaeon]HEX55404.1 3-isopropylmalate dehydratase small subunit [Candidatus Altiarchaeales archaeon]